MSKFDKWINKMLVNKIESVADEEQEDTQQSNMHTDYDKKISDMTDMAKLMKPKNKTSKDINIYNRILRDMSIKNVKQQIASSSSNGNKIYADAMKNEVNISDVDSGLDKALDTILIKKLDIYDDGKLPVVITAKMRKELDDQEAIHQQRKAFYNERITNLYGIIKSNDCEKQSRMGKDAKFSTYEDNNQKDEEDDSMGNIEDKRYCGANDPNIMFSLYL